MNVPKSAYDYFDRHGRKLAVGQTIRVQSCIGPYGQTELVEGHIRWFSPYGGALLSDAVRIVRPQLARQLLGDHYTTLTRSGYEKSNDYEHGHEKWTEIVEEGT